MKFRKLCNRLPIFPALNPSLLIINLLALVCPIAIRRLIVSVVISAFYGKFWVWSFPHVVKEVFKVIPSFTYRYSTASVSMITRMIFVSASLFHGVPYRILWRFIHSVFAVANARTPPCLKTASARFGVSSRKRFGWQNNLFSTVTPAFPESATNRLLFAFFQDHELAISLTDSIYESSHTKII